MTFYEIQRYLKIQIKMVALDTESFCDFELLGIKARVHGIQIGRDWRVLYRRDEEEGCMQSRSADPGSQATTLC